MTEERYTIDQLRDAAADAARELFREQAEDTPDESGEDIIAALQYDGRDHEAADGAIPHEYWKLGEIAADFVRTGAELDDSGLIGENPDFIQIVQVHAYEQASQAVYEALSEIAAEWDAARDSAENPDGWEYWQGALDELAELCSPAPQNRDAIRQKLRKAYPYSAEEIPPGMIAAEIEDHHGAYLITFPDGASVLVQGDDVETLDQELATTTGHTDATDADAVPVYYLYNADPSPEAEAEDSDV